MKTKLVLKVSDLMTRNVVTVAEEAELTDAIRLLEKEALSMLPVVDKSGSLCGVLSISDLIQWNYNLQFDVAVLSVVSEPVRKTLCDAITENNKDTRVSDVMTSRVKMVSAVAEISAAAQALIDNDVHHFPVVDSSGRPVGIISTTDIVRAVALHLDEWFV